MQNYRRLSVWRKAHALALNVHRSTNGMVGRERAGLVGQIQRAAVSIPANIAEGSARATDRDFAKFLQIAVASATELEYHLQFAADAGLLAAAEFERCERQITEVRRMLFGLIKKVRQADLSSRRLSDS
jgi:four helix bundle protein